MSGNIQEELKTLYKTILSVDKLNELSEPENLSAPLLLNIQESYLKSKPRIMFVGKETNHWLTKNRPSEDRKGINFLINHFDEAFQRLFHRYDEALSDNFEKTKSDFFTVYNKFTNGELGSVVWNNLFKMSYDQKKSKKNNFSKSSINHSDVLRKLSKDTFIGELEILKPDILIFVTGADYDKVIKDFFPNYETINVKIKKRLWKFKLKIDNKEIICYRTIHPYYYKRNQKTEEDYYQLILDDIKDNNAI